MATFRVGLGSFNINDGSVGIGTETTGHGNLKVEGTLKSTSADVLGVSTFARYSGFFADNVNVNNRDLTLSGEYSTTGDIVVEDGASLTVGLGSTACVGSVECISVKNHFSVPVGDTAQRNESAGYAEGTVRYNVDFGTMEFFNGNEWRQFNMHTASGRGVIRPSPSPAGGEAPNSVITTFSVVDGGTNTSWGNLSAGNYAQGGACSSATRILMAGGTTYANPYAVINNIDYKAIASDGNTNDFGDLTVARRAHTALSSSTRGLFVGGVNPGSQNVIDYVEISSEANALDFGDCVDAARHQESGCSSPTRGVFIHGNPSNEDHIDTVKISSKGNAVEFGDRMFQGGYTTGNCNGTRALFGGGYNQSPLNSPTTVRGQIGKITMSSFGRETKFGDLAVARYHSWGLTSKTRAVFLGGITSPSGGLTIDSVFYASGGTAVQFGELDRARWSTNGSTDCHGGLGGF